MRRRGARVERYVAVARVWRTRGRSAAEAGPFTPGLPLWVEPGGEEPQKQGLSPPDCRGRHRYVPLAGGTSLPPLTLAGRDWSEWVGQDDLLITVSA